MHKYISAVTEGIIDEIDDSVKQTLNILVLGVLQEEGEIVILWLDRVLLTAQRFEPI